MRASLAMVAAAALLVTGCNPLPRDPANTLKTIEASKRIRVGLIADPQPLAPARTHALLHRLGQETGAAAIVQTGATEPLLDRLQHGELDLVIGNFSEKTPWEPEVALGPPIAVTGPEDRRLQLRAAARNGENAWIVKIEKASKAVAPEEARK